MNCCNCCTNTLELGCFHPCGLIFDASAVVGALEAGVWSLELAFGRRNLKYEETLIVGQQIRFYLFNINENYTFVAVIKRPDGTIFTVTDAGIIYDCFQFTTKFNFNNLIIL